MMKDGPSIENRITILTSAALETMDPAEQLKIVKLLLAIRNLQYTLHGDKYRKDPTTYPPHGMFPFLR